MNLILFSHFLLRMTKSLWIIFMFWTVHDSPLNLLLLTPTTLPTKSSLVRNLWFPTHILVACSKPWTCYPPVSKESREVANLNKRKSPHTLLYGGKEFVCFLAGNSYPNLPHSQGGMKFATQMSPLLNYLELNTKLKELQTNLLARSKAD